MIRLEGVSKWFHVRSGRVRVLDDITLTLPAGRSVALLGRNGAGKSTLLQIIAGTMRPTSGRVIRDGETSWPIGHANSLHPEMTGLQNTRFLARLYGVDSDALAAFVEAFADIGPHFHMPLRTLSAGMKSRLSFGVAMGIPFRTYLIDEVTGAGDRAFRQHSRKVFRERMHGADAIMISHSMRDLRAFCDCGLVLHDGRLEFFDQIEEAIRYHEALSEAQLA